MSSAHDVPVYQDASDEDSPISSNLLYKRRMTAPGNFAGISKFLSFDCKFGQLKFSLLLSF